MIYPAIFAVLSSILITTASAQVQPSQQSLLGAREAHAAAVSGALVLLDIRSPDEWRETGVPASGHAITMHQPQARFLAELAAATGNSKTTPIALICAVGGRSATLQRWLTQAGYTAVSDVSEGMIGSTKGPGWIKSGLPTRTWTGRVAP